MNEKDISIDDILEGFKSNGVADADPVKRTPLTIWVPIEYKEKYDQIQGNSRGRFCKALQRVLMRSIDKVWAGSESA